MVTATSQAMNGRVRDRALGHEARTATAKAWVERECEWPLLRHVRHSSASSASASPLIGPEAGQCANAVVRRAWYDSLPLDHRRHL
jgi:hypothetical protein